jgi:hypothetical protein
MGTKMIANFTTIGLEESPHISQRISKENKSLSY